MGIYHFTLGLFNPLYSFLFFCALSYIIAKVFKSTGTSLKIHWISDKELRVKASSSTFVLQLLYFDTMNLTGFILESNFKK